MRHRLALGVLSAVLLALSTSGGQEPTDKPEPPDVLKKKVRPAAPAEDKGKPTEPKAKEEVKPEERTKEKIDPGPDPARTAQEILDRIARNIKTAEERLKAKDAGAGTQQVQRDIVKDLDALIEQEQAQQPQDQQAGAGSGNQPQGKSGSRSSRPSRGSRQPQVAGQAKSQTTPSNQGEQPPQAAAQQGGNQPGPGGNSPADINKLADLYKDVWGHLPETLRQEIDAYQKEGYMTKYRELLKQYYATIAEKARRQAERER